ncbi:transposase [Streptomyces sp. GESEQ-35]|uniref:transposase n=1 Tax=Streptomyces sp. GESEQ-35 TaxID=2812657 RepID=UPI0024A79058|nr:transposase [Streptomyces sp. GESEQ-35]
MGSDAEVDSWDAELESLLLRVGERFGRVEPRRRMRDYVRGLLGPVGRKNSWQIAEHAGNDTPYGLQRLLSWCQWDPDEIRDDLRDYVADQLGQPARWARLTRAARRLRPPALAPLPAAAVELLCAASRAHSGRICPRLIRNTTLRSHQHALPIRCEYIAR